MRTVLLSLAAGLSLVSAPALAWEPTAEQTEEAHCIYTTLSPLERVELGVNMSGNDEQAAAVAESVDLALFNASMICGDRYGWGDSRPLAAVDYALAAATMEVGLAMMPEHMTPKMLENIFAQFDGDLAYGFAFAAQDTMDEPTFEAWTAKAEQALIAKGVAPEDLDPAFIYLASVADLALVSMTWEDLFTSGKR